MVELTMTAGIFSMVSMMLTGQFADKPTRG